ncbi:hypothetical protein WJX77_010659 [Trebouxia sp. C0004]
MSRSDSLTSILSQQETRTASTSLLVIGILVGGSAATAALWLRSKRSLLWGRQDVDKWAQLPDKSVADQYICVLDGLSKPYRRDAIEVATCFGITDVWVVAIADASDLKDDYQQAKADTTFTSNGHSITMRIFPTAQECCDALAAEDWMVCIASGNSKPSRDAAAADKKAVVVAVPFPSQPFVVAQQGATAELIDESGSLPAAAALALTLHHLTGGKMSQSRIKQQSRAGHEARSLQHDASPPQTQQPRHEGEGIDTTPDADIGTDSHAEPNQAPGPQPPPLSETESESDAQSDSDSASKSGPQDKHAVDNSIHAQPSGADDNKSNSAAANNFSGDKHEQAPDCAAGAGAQSAGQSSGNQRQAMATVSGRAAMGAASQAGDGPANLQSNSKEETNGSSKGDLKGKPKRFPQGSPEGDAQRDNTPQSFFSSAPSPPFDINPARSDPGSNVFPPPARPSASMSGATTSKTSDSQGASASPQSAMSQAASAQAAKNAGSIPASEMSRLQAQAMRRSGVLRRHGMGNGTSSRASSSMGSPTGSVASVSTSGWPDSSPAR